ncbi:hypothetical protein [Corynebacterium ulceribovis]|uniref:hypothetical protein n=1 Tax=Corynebacterium ulceribovis TaxID=487732 RepID=UPI00039AB6EB|nr:hypothetical protein [Corynebacterium ulceribovis]
MSDKQYKSESAATPPARPRKSSKRKHIGTLIFVLVAALATLGLSYWQFSRWESASGSFQNLGYALQWPAFGIFFIWAYRQFLKYESEREEEEALESGELVDEDGTIARRKAQRDAVMTEIPEDFLPPRTNTTSNQEQDK